MRFADLFLTCALVVFVAVLAAPVLLRVARGIDPGARLSPPVRRAAWLGGLCGSTLLVGQALVVDQVADAGATGPDLAALDWSVAHRVGWAVDLGRLLAVLGGPAAMAVLAAAGVAVLWARRARAEAVVVAAAALGAVALVNGFKHLYARSRPPPADQVIHYLNQALPSGHALGSTVVVGMLAALLVLCTSTRGRVVVLAFVFVLAVGMSRVYLAAHWLTDVLVGWLLGGAWLTVGVTALVVAAPARRDARSAPVRRPRVMTPG
ncbi:MAG: phosphatase PAP2 family protein [Actinomycetota bacterium]|nr:phosphatase PAP2 family protein [Actinomycetota bacterium]